MVSAHTRFWLMAGAFSIAVLRAGACPAVEPYAPTPAEIAQMPDYCQAKVGGPAFAAQQANWSERFGALWNDMHHYCLGLKNLQRASRPGISQQDKGYNLTQAIGEFDYMLHSRSAPGHWFLPQIHLQKALTYTRMGQHERAAAEFKLAKESERR